MLKPKIVCISCRSVKPLSLCAVAYLRYKAEVSSHLIPGHLIPDMYVCTVSQKHFKQLFNLMYILHFVCVHV